MCGQVRRARTPLCYGAHPQVSMAPLAEAAAGGEGMEEDTSEAGGGQAFKGLAAGGEHAVGARPEM